MKIAGVVALLALVVAAGFGGEMDLLVPEEPRYLDFEDILEEVEKEQDWTYSQPPAGAFDIGTRTNYTEPDKPPVQYKYKYRTTELVRHTYVPPKYAPIPPEPITVPVPGGDGESPESLLGQSGQLDENGQPINAAAGAAGQVQANGQEAAGAQNDEQALTQGQNGNLGATAGAVQGEGQEAASTTQGDPVLLSSGQFVTSDTDFSVSRFGVPVSIERRYQSSTDVRGRLGPGWSFNLDSRIVMAREPEIDSLVANTAELYEKARAKHEESVALRTQALTTLTKLEQDVKKLVKCFNSTIGALEAYIANNPGQRQHVLNTFANWVTELKLEKQSRLIPYQNRVVELKATVMALDLEIQAQRIVRDDLYARLQLRLGQQELSRGVLESRLGNGNLVENKDDWTLAGAGRFTWIDSYGIPHQFMSATMPSFDSPATYPNGQRNYYPQGAEFLSTIPDDATLFLNPDGTFRVTMKDGTTYFYDFTGRLAALETLNGVRTGIEYTDGNLSRVLVNGVLVYQFEVDPPSGRIRRISGPGGTYIEYGYNEQGRLSSVRDTAGDVVRYTYSGNLLVETEKPDGSKRTYNYRQEGGRAVQFQNFDEEGSSEKFEYDFPNRRTVFTNPSGIRLTYVFDEDHQEIEVLSDDGGVVQKEYDDAGNLVLVKERVDATFWRETRMAYDSRRNLTWVRHPDATQETWTYTQLNRVTSHTDREGRTTTYSYDGRGNLVLVRYPDGTSDSYIRNQFGLPVMYTDRRGVAYTYTYDQYGYVSSISHPAGSSRFTHDELGNLRQRVDEAGNVWSFDYTPDGRQSYARDPLGNESHWEYDSRKDLVKFTDPRGKQTEYVYDDRHLLLEIRAPENQTTMFRYRDDGKLIERTVNGRATLEYEYDVAGRLARTTQVETGVSISYEYDLAGQLRFVTDPRGFRTEYLYDPAGRVTRIYKESGQGQARVYSEYGYDAVGRIDEVFDGRRNRTVIYTDPVSRRVTVTDPLGAVSTQEIDPYGLPVLARTADNREIRREYDFRGNLVSVTDGEQNETRYRYDVRGLLSEAVDPAGGVTRFTYDLAGRLVSVTDPEGNSQTRSYDAAGNVVRLTDGNSNVTTRSFDGLNRPVRVTDPAGNSTSYEYDALGNVSKVVDAANGQWLFNYDPAGRLLWAQDPSGVRVNHSYDEAGNLLRSVDASGVETTWEYDGRGLPIRMTGSDGQTYRFVFDADGRQIAEIAPGPGSAGGAAAYSTGGMNPDGGQSSYQWIYDAAGRLSREIDRLGNEQRYEYTPGGLLKARYDFSNRRTLYYYDERGLLTLRSYDDGTEERFQYDSNGRLMSATTPETALSWRYDLAGRLVSTVDHKLGEALTYSYDAAGNRTSLSYQSSGRRFMYQYDARNLLVKAIDPDGLAIRIFYDELGRETGRDLPNGTVEQRAYDGAGRLSWYRIARGEYPQDGGTAAPGSRRDIGSATRPVTAVITDILKAEAYLYDKAGRRSGMVDQSGNLTLYEYDTMGRLAETAYARQSGKAQADWQELVNLGLRQGAASREPSTVWINLPSAQRSGLEQLFSVVRESTGAALRTFERFWSESFKYDKRGNRTSKETGWGTINYEYDANDRVIRAGDRTFAYDANGNLTSETTANDSVTYTYTLEQRLRSAVRVNDGRTAATSYAYDALGRRSRETSGAFAEGYLYDGMTFESVGVYSLAPEKGSQYADLQKGQRASSVVAPGERQDLWGAGQNIAEPAARQTEEHQWLNGGSFAIRGQASRTNYQHRDALGSIIYVTTQPGHRGENFAYDTFGVPIQGMSLTGAPTSGGDWWGPYSTPASNPGDQATQRYAYNGKVLDKLTGMYDYGYRHYSAQVGRFTTVDPIKDGMNWYAYVGNDPVNFVDPLGMDIRSVTDTGMMNSKDTDWYGLKLGSSQALVRKEGCTAVANLRAINAETGNLKTPLFWTGKEDGVQYLDGSGGLYRDDAWQGETGNTSSWTTVKNTPANPNAIRNTLAELEASENQYFVIARATITYIGTDGQSHNSPHEINVTEVTLNENGSVDDQGFTWMATSVLDTILNRAYTLGTGAAPNANAANGVFTIQEIRYVQSCNN